MYNSILSTFALQGYKLCTKHHILAKIYQVFFIIKNFKNFSALAAQLNMRQFYQQFVSSCFTNFLLSKKYKPKPRVHTRCPKHFCTKKLLLNVDEIDTCWWSRPLGIVPKLTIFFLSTLPTISPLIESGRELTNMQIEVQNFLTERITSKNDKTSFKIYSLVFAVKLFFTCFVKFFFPYFRTLQYFSLDLIRNHDFKTSAL